MSHDNITHSARHQTGANDKAMSVDKARAVARFFQVLSDPTRVRLVRLLAKGEWCVSDLTTMLGMDQPAVSHQLKYLRDLDLVRWTKTGRHVYYTLDDAHLQDVLLSSLERLDGPPQAANV